MQKHSTESAAENKNEGRCLNTGKRDSRPNGISFNALIAVKVINYWVVFMGSAVFWHNVA